MELSKAHQTSNFQNYETPIEFFRLLELSLGVEFTLDLAASDSNHLCESYYTEENDAFFRSWAAPSIVDKVTAIFANPPYSEKKHPVSEWISYAYHFSDYENFVFLLPLNKCDQPWYHDMIGKAYIGFVKGRIQYLIDGKMPEVWNEKNQKYVKSNNSQGSILICMGPHFQPGIFSIDWAGYKKRGCK